MSGSSDDDGELEFIGQFEKPPPNVLAEISLLDDEDEEPTEIQVDSDSEITIIEYIPPPSSKTNAKNGSGCGISNSLVKKMSSHQNQSKSNGNQLKSPQITDGDVNEILIIDGEQNDNGELVVASKSLKKKKKRKNKAKNDLNSSKSESCNENGGLVADEEIGKKKAKKKKKDKKGSTQSNDPKIGDISIRDPVFVGKKLHVIPVPSIAIDSTLNFLNFYNQQNAPSIDSDSSDSISTSTKESWNTKDANINVNDNFDKINNIIDLSMCQPLASYLNVPTVDECTSDIVTTITITSPNNNSHVSGAENTVRKVELVQIPKLNKSDADLESNDEQVQYVESLNELKSTTKKTSKLNIMESDSSHEDEFKPEAQSMNHFIKRLGISRNDSNSSVMATCTSIMIEEIAKNAEGLVVKNVKRKRSSSIDGDVIPITESDDVANPSKKQVLSWRIDKNPEGIEQSVVEVIKCASTCNEEVTTTKTRKDCFEKDDSTLMGPPPPPPKNVPVQNHSSLTTEYDENPHPWNPIVIREISTNNKLGLPNSWTQDVIDFYNKPHEDFDDLKCVFKSMRDSPHLWKAPYENIRRRDRYVRCNICHQRDHEARFCPERGKLPVCTNCGIRGHTLRGGNRTPSCCKALCLNCGAKSSSGKYEKKCQRCEFTRHGTPVQCALCGMKGHVERVCPDLWRRYHSTTTPLSKELLDKMPTAKDLREKTITPAFTSKTEYKPESKLYCSNCTGRYHNYFHCQRSLYSKYSPNKPNVIVDLPISGQVHISENEKAQDNSTECESTSKQDQGSNKQNEPEVIFLDSGLIPNKIEKRHNESRLCPSFSLPSSYELSRSSSTSTSYASGYSKKNLDIIYSADLPKSKGDMKEPESTITFSQLTTSNTSKSSKSPHSRRSSSRSDEVKSSRKRYASRMLVNDYIEHSSKKPAYSNSARSRSPIKWAPPSDRDSSRRSNQRYYDSYRHSRNRDRDLPYSRKY